MKNFAVYIGKSIKEISRYKNVCKEYNINHLDWVGSDDYYGINRDGIHHSADEAYWVSDVNRVFYSVEEFELFLEVKSKNYDSEPKPAQIPDFISNITSSDMPSYKSFCEANGIPPLKDGNTGLK